jgi:twitching motility protein PilT
MNPCLVSANGTTDVASSPMQGTQISMMIFPLIPADVKQELPNRPEIQFVYPNDLGEFSFHVQKSPAGFNVTVTSLSVAPTAGEPAGDAPRDFLQFASNAAAQPSPEPAPPPASFSGVLNEPGDEQVVEFVTEMPPAQPTLTPAVPVSPPPAVPVPEFEPPTVAAVSLPVVPVAETGSSPQMDLMFSQMAAAGASDLHLSVGMPPMVRRDGKIQPLAAGSVAISPEEMKRLLTSIMPEKNRTEFGARHDTDFAYEIAGLARFRCNVFMDRKGMGGVFRIIPAKMTTAEQLGLSKAILGLCDLTKGLVVVTGPTGSGKSTTLCAMVNHVNMTREDHIITIEDPIEFVHENIKCLVNQREVHNHTDSFKDALRAALREDPDILLVGEMRDLETISIAIETAETGHLVFGTLHTTTAASTVDRIIDQFPADRQQQIRVMLSESLKGVIAQTLLPKVGGGRVAALEVLIVTPAISNLIREGKTFQIPSAMQTGRAHGMVMLNDSLFDLVQKGTVLPRDAYLKAVDKTGFESMLTKGGFRI